MSFLAHGNAVGYALSGAEAAHAAALYEKVCSNIAASS
jgi:hypothetical protein